MAWEKSEVTATDAADAFTKIHTFINTTLGWTLHDDQGALATPYYVYYTDGSDGRRRYVQLVRQSTSTFYFMGWRFWNNATQTGTDRISQSATVGLPVQNTPFNLFMYGDDDAVILVSKLGTSYYTCFFELMDTIYDSDFTTTTASAAAGSDVVIAVTDNSIFTVGQKYQILNTNNAVGNQETVEVTAKDTGEITVATLAITHAAGALIGRQPLPILLQQSTTGAAYGSPIRVGGAAATATTLAALTAQTTWTADPVLAQQMLFPYWLPWVADSYVYGVVQNIFNCPNNAIDSESEITIGNTTYKVFLAARFLASSSARIAIKTDVVL